MDLSCLKRRRGSVKGKSREEEMEVELDCIAACNSPDSVSYFSRLEKF